MNAQQLKNSILQMAVSGKLVPQDPSDEPASILLERIRKEKEKLIKEGKIKKEKNPSYIFRGADNTPYEKVGNAEPVSIADEVLFEIPESWEWCRLSNIVFNRGQQKPDAVFCYIDIDSIDNERQCLNISETVLTPDEAPSRARKLVDIGDILYSTVRPYLHNMCIVDRQFGHTPIASTGFAAMTCHTGIYNQYLFRYLMSPSFDAYANDTENSKGVAYPAINDARLYHALIPIPPEKEQRKIIDQLDMLWPFIAKYKSSEEALGKLNTVFPEQLKKSILQLAVQGKLVPQDPHDEPASVLLERIRAEKERLIKEGKIKRGKNESVIYRRDNSHYEKFGSEEYCIDDEIPFDIPESWAWCRLGTIGETNIGLTYKPSDKTTGNGILVLRSSNIQNGKMAYDDCVYVSCEVPERAFIEKGDILICARNGSRSLVGKCAIVDKDGMAFGAFMAKFKSKFNPYIKVFLDSPLFRNQLEGVKTETINQITQDMLRNQLIPVPPEDEQIRILSELDRVIPVINT